MLSFCFLTISTCSGLRKAYHNETRRGVLSTDRMGVLSDDRLLWLMLSLLSVRTNCSEYLSQIHFYMAKCRWPPPSAFAPRLRIAYASAPPTVERVLRQRWRRRRRRRCCCCGLRRLGLPLPLFMWFCLRSVWTKSLTDQTSASYKCRGEERKRERGRDSARVRKGRQAIRWRMAGIVQRCSIFKLSCLEIELHGKRKRERRERGEKRFRIFQLRFQITILRN